MPNLWGWRRGVWNGLKRPSWRSTAKLALNGQSTNKQTPVCFILERCPQSTPWMPLCNQGTIEGVSERPTDTHRHTTDSRDVPLNHPPPRWSAKSLHWRLGYSENQGWWHRSNRDLRRQGRSYHPQPESPSLHGIHLEVCGRRSCSSLVHWKVSKALHSIILKKIVFCGLNDPLRHALSDVFARLSAGLPQLTWLFTILWLFSLSCPLRVI